MKITRIEKVEVDKKFNSYVCDLCGIEMSDEHVSFRKNYVGRSSCDDEVRIESWTYPNVDDNDTHNDMHVTGLNCCIDCFTKKVKPLIENTFNVKFNVEVT
jgi:hypothetical protein